MTATSLRTMHRFCLLLAGSFAILLVAATAASAAAAPQLEAGFDHVCVVSDAGASDCWGYNVNGELGRGTSGFNTPIPGPITVAGGFGEISVGGDTTCVVINAGGTVSCWGYGSGGSLGNGHTSNSATPVTVTGLSNVTQVWGGAAGEAEFCAEKGDGSVWCWGDNFAGQFGDGTSSPAVSTPVEVAALHGAKKVVFGENANCAILADASLACAGDDSSGELGLGPGDNSTKTLTTVPGISGVTDLETSDTTFCASLSNGTVDCWGTDDYGRLGNGPTNTSTAESPAPVPGLTGIAKLGGSYAAVCAVSVTSSLYCWGSNANGDIGLGTMSSTPVASPTPVPGATDVIALTDGRGNDPLCALRRGGVVSCWGYNADGDAGINNGGASLASPTPVPGIDLVTLAYPGSGTALSVPARATVNKKKTSYALTGVLVTTPDLLVSPSDACTGAATASATYTYSKLKTVKSHGRRKHKKVKVTKTVKATGTLSQTGANCAATFTLKLPVKYLNARRVSLAASAVGNGSLQPVTASTTYKLPKVKIKKKTKKRH